MEKPIILSWNNGDAAKGLAEALGCRLAKHKAERKLPSRRPLINLGCSTDHPVMSRVQDQLMIINNPAQVRIAQSKQATLQVLGHQIAVPFISENSDRSHLATLVECVVEKGQSFVARTHDRGSSGSGIVMVTPDNIRDGIPRAAAYTQAIDKRREYRVHIGFSSDGAAKIIDVTRKIRRPDVDDTNRPFIWNHDNDFIFVRNGVNAQTVPPRVITKARAAVRALGLQFGAVDVIVPRGGKITDAPAYVLEVNTSPGMEGTTLDRYAEFFNHLLSGGKFTPWQGDSGEELLGQNDE